MNSIDVYESDFMLWGSRSYVQGTFIVYEMFRAISRWNLGEIAFFSAIFKQIVSKQGKFLLFADRSKLIDFRNDLKFFSDVHTGRGIYSIGLMESAGSVLERTADDEASLVSRAEIDDRGVIRCWEYPADRLITVMVSLNKRLHKQMLLSEGYGPWVLARLDLQWGRIELDRQQAIEIFIDQNIGGRLTKAIVEMNGKRVGEIQFNRKMLS